MALLSGHWSTCVYLLLLQEDRTYNNGLIYKFDMIFKNKNNIEERVENKLFVRLVDAQTKEVLIYVTSSYMAK